MPGELVNYLINQITCITDPFSFSLSSFYTLHYNIIMMSCVAIPSPKHFHVFNMLKNVFLHDGKFQGCRADILAARCYSLDFPEKLEHNFCAIFNKPPNSTPVLLFAGKVATY